MRTVLIDLGLLLLGIALAKYPTIKQWPGKYWRRRVKRREVIPPMPESTVKEFKKIWAAKGEPGYIRPATQSELIEDACFSVWLHGDFGYLTKKMTTEERNAFADGIDRARVRMHAEDNEEATPIHRWWKEYELTEKEEV